MTGSTRQRLAGLYVNFIKSQCLESVIYVTLDVALILQVAQLAITKG